MSSLTNNATVTTAPAFYTPDAIKDIPSSSPSPSPPSSKQQISISSNVIGFLLLLTVSILGMAILSWFLKLYRSCSNCSEHRGDVESGRRRSSSPSPSPSAAAGGARRMISPASFKPSQKSAHACPVDTARAAPSASPLSSRSSPSPPYEAASDRRPSRASTWHVCSASSERTLAAAPKASSSAAARRR